MLADFSSTKNSVLRTIVERGDIKTLMKQMSSLTAEIGGVLGFVSEFKFICILRITLSINPFRL